MARRTTLRQRPRSPLIYGSSRRRRAVGPRAVVAVLVIVAVVLVLGRVLLHWPLWF